MIECRQFLHRFEFRSNRGQACDLSILNQQSRPSRRSPIRIAKIASLTPSLFSQESKVRPVGAHAEIPVDVRIITATNRKLPQEIAIGRFRQDLFYRIAVLTIGTPPLRERASDIPLLVEHFLREAAKDMKRAHVPGIASDAIAALSMYTWPGNVRQLQNIVQRLVAGLTNGHPISASEVSEALQEVTMFEASPQVTIIFRPDDSLDGFLDRILLGLYTHFRTLTGSHTDAARILRIDRVALYSRVKRARDRMNGDGCVSDEDQL